MRLNTAIGQTMTIVVHPNSGKLDSLVIYREDAGRLKVAPSKSGVLAWRGKLPNTGHYVIVIDGASHYAPTPYSMTVAIR